MNETKWKQQAIASPSCDSGLSDLLFPIQLDPEGALPRRPVARGRVGCCSWALLAAVCWCAALLSGCGSISGNSGLTVSPGSISFGSVSVGQSVTGSLTLTNTGSSAIQVTQMSLTGPSFSVIGTTLPMTIAGGATSTVQVQFSPTSAGGATGQLTVGSNASSSGTATVQLDGTGTQVFAAAAVGVLNGLSCTSNVVAGTATDNCTVTLSAGAGSGGLTVNLSSNSAAMTVPATVTVPANATSATFPAQVSAVTSSQTAVLTASANAATATFSVLLAASGPMLSVNATSVSFGTVALNSTSTQSVILTAAGTQPVTVSAIAVTGTGFSLASISLPLTLNPGQTATLNLSFLPTVLGSFAGQMTITSNASSAGTVVVGLTGTGASTTTYQIDLTWQAPASSSDPVVGYNVYRSTGGGAFQLLNPVVTTRVSFVDNNVQNGVSYGYYVTSVDSAGNESAPSNTWSAAIP